MMALFNMAYTLVCDGFSVSVHLAAINANYFPMGWMRPEKQDT